jgi:hypothetical protein
MPTSGPAEDPAKSFSIGTAAHITAAAVGGPRYDASLTPKQRASIENAIWLCRSCGTMIDCDPDLYTAPVLKDWKKQAENRARNQTKAKTEYRAIARSELHTQLTLGERGVLLALEEEFGCQVKINAQVPHEQGWLNLHAAVVRGEDLIAIQIIEYKGGGFPYVAPRQLINLGPKLHFPRFNKFVLYVAVVSDAAEELDEPIRAGLNKLASEARCEVYIRMYRLKALLAKYNL